MRKSMCLAPDLPISKQISRILYRDIVACRIPPGMPLSEKDVALRFGVSRQPVREVFIRLAENGLITIRPQRGSYVTRISLPQVSEVAFIRQALECALVRKVISDEAQPDLYLQLEENLYRQKRAVRNKQDYGDFLSYDDEFHALIAEAAGCRLAWSTINNIKPAIDRVRYLSLQVLISPGILCRQHHEIYESIRCRDSKRGEAAMHEHLNDITHSVQQIYLRWPEWFSLS